MWEDKDDHTMGRGELLGRKIALVNDSGVIILISVTVVVKGAASPSLTPDFKRGGGPSTYKPLLFFLEGMQSVLL